MRNFYAAIIAFIFFVFIFSPNAVQAVSVRVPILMYHYVREVNKNTDPLGYNLSIDPPEFEKQLQYLKDND